MNELDNMKTQWEYDVFGESGDTQMRWDKIAPAGTRERLPWQKRVGMAQSTHIR